MHRRVAQAVVVASQWFGSFKQAFPRARTNDSMVGTKVGLDMVGLKKFNGKALVEAQLLHKKRKINARIILCFFVWFGGRTRGCVLRGRPFTERWCPASCPPRSQRLAPAESAAGSPMIPRLWHRVCQCLRQGQVAARCADGPFWVERRELLAYTLLTPCDPRL